MFGIGLVTILFSIAAFAQPTIAVRPYSKVVQSEVTLADIAEFNDITSADLKILKKINFGKSPEVGKQKAFTAREVSEIFRRQSKAASLSHIKLKIPREVIIANTGYELSRKAVIKTLMSQWRRLCKNCHFNIKSLSLPLLPQQIKHQPWKITAPTALPRGSFSSQLMVKRQGRRPFIYWITGQLEIQRKVPVTTRAISFGTRITAKDIKFKYRDTTFAADTSPALEEIVGRKLRQSMKAGDIVWRQNLIRDPALRRGDLIKVRAGTDEFEVTLLAVAEQNGFVGDRVKIRNRETNKILVGLVVAEGEVKIE